MVDRRPAPTGPCHTHGIVPTAESASTPPWTISDAAAPGILAVRSYWKPFLLIQIASIILVLVYYRWDALQELAASLAAFKVAGGLPFAFAAGAVAGGVVPEVAKALTRTLPGIDRWWFVQVVHTSIVFGLVGIFVDLFYRFQGVLFGTGIDPLTLTYKTMLDMLAFAPLFCVPFEVATLEWGHHRYRMRVLWQNLGLLAYRDRVLPAMIPCWAYWIPVLACVYSLPQDLQFPFAILTEAAWSIIVVFVTKRNAQVVRSRPAAAEIG